MVALPSDTLYTPFCSTHPNHFGIRKDSLQLQQQQCEQSNGGVWDFREGCAIPPWTTTTTSSSTITTKLNPFGSQSDLGVSYKTQDIKWNGVILPSLVSSTTPLDYYYYYSWDPLTLSTLLIIVHTQITLASERTHFSCSSSPRGWFGSPERVVLPHEYQ